MGFNLGSIFGIGNTPPGSQYMGQTDLNSYGPAPGSSALQSMLGSMGQSLKSMPQFQPITAGSITAPTDSFQSNAYQAKDMSNTDLPQYDAMRQRLNSQYSQQQSQSQDSLDRQFAAMGGGPGNGAQAKQTENLSAGIAQQKGQDLLNVNAQEAQTRTGLQQQQDQMAFQSGETQKGYGFQAQQNAAQMGFVANQFNAQQGTQSQEFNQQMGQQQNQFNFGAASQLFGAQSSINSQNLEYQKAQMDANTTAFNESLSQYQAIHSGGLLGGGGFLGTGIGA